MKELHIKYHTRSVKIHFFWKQHTSKIQQYEKKEDIIKKKKPREKNSYYFGNYITAKNKTYCYCSQNKLIFIMYIQPNFYSLYKTVVTLSWLKEEFGTTCKSF